MDLSISSTVSCRLSDTVSSRLSITNPPTSPPLPQSLTSSRMSLSYPSQSPPYSAPSVSRISSYSASVSSTTAVSRIPSYSATVSSTTVFSPTVLPPTVHSSPTSSSDVSSTSPNLSVVMPPSSPHVSVVTPPTSPHVSVVTPPSSPESYRVSAFTPVTTLDPAAEFPRFHFSKSSTNPLPRVPQMWPAIHLPHDPLRAYGDITLSGLPGFCK